VKVGLDATHLFAKPSGARTRLTTLYGILAKKGHELSVWVRPSAGMKEFFAALGARVIEVPFPAPAFLRGFKAFNAPAKGADRPGEIDLFLAEALPLPDLKHIPTVATLHDLRYLKPDLSSPVRQFYGRRLLARNLARAQRLVTVSRAMHDDLIQAYPCLDENRIEVVPNGVPSLLPLSEDRIAKILADLSIAAPFFICLGHLEPRKNLKHLLRAFARFKDSRQDAAPVRLVLAGQPQQGCTRERVLSWASEAGLTEGRDVLVLGPVSEEERSALLRGALLAVQPSRYEGFGLGVLEALAHEIPVACSLIPAHEEVAGPAAFFFDPCSLEETARILVRAAFDDRERAARIAEGLAQSKIFSWHESAELLENVWGKALDR
jgi:alpha-1,3-rhamnosyl/mannosyltransferase